MPGKAATRLIKVESINVSSAIIMVIMLLYGAQVLEYADAYTHTTAFSLSVYVRR